MLGIRINRDRRLLSIRRCDLGLAVLQIARKIGKEAGGDLHTDPVPREESVARDQIVQINLIDLPRGQPLWSARQISVAGTLDIKTRAHNVEGNAIRRGIEYAHPQIQVAAIARDEYVRMDGSGNFHIVLQGWRVEGKNIRAFGKFAIVVRAGRAEI